MGPWRIINTNKSPMDFLSSGKEMDQVAMEHGSQRNRVSMLSHTQARTTRTRLCCRRREPRRIPSFPLWHDAWAVCVHTGVWRGTRGDLLLRCAPTRHRGHLGASWQRARFLVHYLLWEGEAGRQEKVPCKYKNNSKMLSEAKLCSQRLSSFSLTSTPSSPLKGDVYEILLITRSWGGSLRKQSWFSPGCPSLNL